VCIGDLEAHLGEMALASGWSLPSPTKMTGRTVLVVGSGPAGLGAAHALRQAGHAVTMVEAMPLPGGMMRRGISPARLPRDLLDRELERLWATGIELRCGRVVRRGSILQDGYDAAVIAMGASMPTALLRGRVIWSQPVHLDDRRTLRTATTALGRGRRAALAINAALAGSLDVVPGRSLQPVDVCDLTPWRYRPVPRKPIDGLVEATNQARRCFHCGSCIACAICYSHCPDDAIRRDGPATFRIDLDFCKGCGICAEECPVGAIAMTPECR
jgi:2-oxoacid:acceptor oxidoreductase delta subunit (pyruvate/2-ketoisovalerate family)